MKVVKFCHYDGVRRKGRRPNKCRKEIHVNFLPTTSSAAFGIIIVGAIRSDLSEGSPKDS